MSFSRKLFILALASFFLSGCKSEELQLRLQESAPPIAFKAFQWGANFFSQFGGSGLNYESITLYAVVPGARSMTLGDDGTLYVGSGGIGGKTKRVFMAGNLFVFHRLVS